MLPSVVMDTSAIEWPTQRNAMVGPFETATHTFGFSPDYSGLRLRAHASDDNGHTWSEQDAGNAPTIPSSTLKHMSVDNSGSTFYICMPGSTTTCNIHVFDAATLTWGTTLVGPTINWSNAGNGQTVVWYFYRSGVHVIAAQVLPEATWRRCAVYYGTPGAWTGPLYISTGTTSLPGTAEHEDLQYALPGSSGRFHLFWLEGTHASTNPLMTRAFTSANTFGTTIDLNAHFGSMIFNSGSFNFGVGCQYDSGTRIAVLVSTVTYILRVESALSDTAANWSRDTVSPLGGGVVTNTNPGVVMNDAGTKLWVWRVFNTTLRTIQFADDGGTGAWSDFTDWKPENYLEIYGISARLMGDRIGLFYCDTGVGASLKYDQLHIYQSKVSQGAGTYVTESDLGVGGVPDYLIYKDDVAGLGISNTIEVRMREDEGVLWGDPLITLGTDSSDSRDIANTGQTARFIQITETIAGGSMESGVAGT